MAERDRVLDPRTAAFAVLIWGVVLLYGTLRPSYEAVEPLFPHADKVVHLMGWFILAVPAGAMARTRSGRLLGWFACALFGLLIEIGQIFIPGRGFELWDLLADSVGAAIGIAVLHRSDGR